MPAETPPTIEEAMELLRKFANGLGHRRAGCLCVTCSDTRDLVARWDARTPQTAPACDNYDPMGRVDGPGGETGDPNRCYVCGASREAHTKPAPAAVPAPGGGAEATCAPSMGGGLDPLTRRMVHRVGVTVTGFYEAAQKIAGRLGCGGWGRNLDAIAYYLAWQLVLARQPAPQPSPHHAVNWAGLCLQCGQQFRPSETTGVPCPRGAGASVNDRGNPSQPPQATHGDREDAVIVDDLRTFEVQRGPIGDEPPVKRYEVYLCDLCVSGAGGECHSPGCTLWIKRAPDVPLISPTLVKEYGHDPMCMPLPDPPTTKGTAP